MLGNTLWTRNITQKEDEKLATSKDMGIYLFKVNTYYWSWWMCKNVVSVSFVFKAVDDKKKKKKSWGFLLSLLPLTDSLERPLSLRTNATPCIPYSPTTAPVPALPISKHLLGCLGPHGSARLQLHLTPPWRCLCTELPAGLCSRTTYKCGSQLMGHQGRAAQCTVPNQSLLWYWRFAALLTAMTWAPEDTAWLGLCPRVVRHGVCWS